MEEALKVSEAAVVSECGEGEAAKEFGRLGEAARQRGAGARGKQKLLP